ncbi:MAG: hypothetical protein JXB10_05675 [Pirellulales bacterium]|nr:hypothetical protein [Pirellulales bacterium]
MLPRLALASAMVIVFSVPIWGQTPGNAPTESNGAWHAASEISPSPPVAETGTAKTDNHSTAGPAALTSWSASGASSDGASPGNVTLPSDGGQVWREYDISGYTTRVTNTNRPEQAIIDWILRETGYEAWHSDPLGVLSANRRTLRVYHTPQTQAVVADIVGRFLSSEAATQTFSMRVVTLDSPSWRSKGQAHLRPVPVQTPGACAWILAKEDAAILLAELRRRNDYREHSSPYLMVNNGQSTVVSAMRTRPYPRDVLSRPDLPTGYEIQPGQVEEGFQIDFSPLLTADRQMIDATIKCDIDQVEKMIPVTIEVPSAVGARKQADIEAPQMTHYRFHERFRWPVEHVMLIGLGMVPLPLPVNGQSTIAGLPLPFGQTAARGDLLIFIESKGQLPAATTAGARTPAGDARTYRGRY